MSDPSEPLAGRTLSHYEVEAKLGEGGMGEVYRARDTQLHRTVALKVLPASFSSDLDRMRRFLREARTASALNHANIAHIYEVGEAGGVHFIAMEYVVGRSLADILGEGPLPGARVLEIAGQIAEALDEAHAHGVVHRDIKPGNVMVSERGQVKLLDFGLAKALPEPSGEDAQELPTLTKTAAGVVLGTVPYMSPEQALGQPVDARSDIFSLGILMYEAAAGGRPFRAQSAAPLLDQILHEDPPRLSAVNPAVPPRLDRIVARCLRKRREDRYQTAKELLEDLRGGRPGAARWPARRVIAASLVASTLVALGVLAVRSRGGRDAGPAADPGTSGALATGSRVRVLAVLPFRPIGNEETSRLAAAGMMESLSSRLFPLAAVHVVSSRDVEQAGQAPTIEKAARSLGAQLIAEGTVQSVGERLRLVVNLHDIVGKRQVWSQQFTGAYGDLFALQDQVYEEIVKGLAIAPESASATQRPTHDIAAYDLYLKGREALRSRQAPDELRAAVSFFEQAIRKDGGFALAYTGLADASLVMYGETKESLWADKAVGAALRARDLDDRLPEVHRALGSVYVETGKYSEAVSCLRRALELAPGSDDTYRRLGAVYQELGKRSEALEAMGKAVELNPYFWLNHNVLGAALLGFGEPEKALEEFRRVTELEPDNPVGYDNTGNVYFRQGRWEECIPAYEQSLKRQRHWLTLSNLGTAYFFLRRYRDAVQAFEEAVALNPNDSITMGNLADGLRWAGQADRARSTYRKAIALGYKDLQVNPRDVTTLATLALYHAKTGNDARALELIRQARSLRPNSAALCYYEAVVHALGGREPEAVAALEKALDGGYSPREAAADPELAGLAQSDAFRQLLRRHSGPST